MYYETAKYRITVMEVPQRKHFFLFQNKIYEYKIYT